jgi:hypothetical protein
VDENGTLRDIELHQREIQKKCRGRAAPSEKASYRARRMVIERAPARAACTTTL